MARTKNTPETVEKTCPVCNKQFAVSYYLRTRRTYCSKSCSNHDPNVIDKMITSQKKTFDEKYGTHPMKTEETKKKLVQSVRRKYGVDWISEKTGWYDKVKETKLQLHGKENYNNIEKIKKTCLERYGVDNPAKNNEIRKRIDQTRRDNHYDEVLKYCTANKIKVLFNKEEYNGYAFTNKYPFQCEVCDYKFNNSIYCNVTSIFCEKCNPDKRQTLENSFFNFLTSLTPALVIQRHDRTVLYGKELDFYLPDKKLAIDINGLYWHSEHGNGIHKQCHLNKSKGCIAHGIRLVQIFENELRDKEALVYSVVKTILKMQISNVIYARNCIVKLVDIKEKDEFLNQNHLQQADKSTIKLGLYHDNVLVSLMTFREKSRFDRKVQWELSRFCNLKDTIVTGGASKLFSHFIKTYSPSSILSYSDRRYFSGDLYHMLGFRFISNSIPSYHYITPDYKTTINRMNFQKHLLSKKLEIFDESLSEWENMKHNGYDRIWDCGHGKWLWTAS